MKKIVDGIYVHRKQFITREEIGWSVEDNLEVFKTLNDAIAYVDKCHSNCNKTVTYKAIQHAGKSNERVLEQKTAKLQIWGEKEVFCVRSRTIEAA